MSRFALPRRLAPVSVLCAALAAAACAGSPAPVSGPGDGVDSGGRIERTERATGEAFEAAGETTREGLPGAATAPLEDLNLRRDEIPQELADIAYVYNATPAPDCRAIRREIERLDAVLGRDYDVEAEEISAGTRGGAAAGDLVVDSIRGVTTGVIPFRSVVREASGAAAFERRRAKAFAAGYARRAYLKGLALGQGCAPPAAPRVIVTPPDGPRVEMRETRDEPAHEDWGAPVDRREP